MWVLVSKLVTALFFLLTFLVTFRWFQTAGFRWEFFFAGFWRWLWDDGNSDGFEPLITVLGFIGVPVSLVTTVLLSRIQRLRSGAQENAFPSELDEKEWERVRPKLIKVIRHDWVKAHLDGNPTKESWIFLSAEEAPDAHALTPDIEHIVEQKRESGRSSLPPHGIANGCRVRRSLFRSVDRTHCRLRYRVNKLWTSSRHPVIPSSRITACGSRWPRRRRCPFPCGRGAWWSSSMRWATSSSSDGWAEVGYSPTISY